MQVGRVAVISDINVVAAPGDILAVQGLADITNELNKRKLISTIFHVI
jgi:hypothetical protein